MPILGSVLIIMTITVKMLFISGSPAHGDKGLTAVPHKRDAFEADLSRTIAYAKALDCKR